MPLHEWTPSQRRNGQGEIEEYQKDLRTWLFEEESFVPLALFQDGKAYSIVTDHLGTPVEAYNEKGEEVWYRRLDMNGKVIEERSMLYTSYNDYVKIPFLFQGQYYDDEIKLAYNRFRYYSPEIGRYISEDPIRFASGTLSLFSYVEDPNVWIDILGLSCSYDAKKLRKNMLASGEMEPDYKNAAHHIVKSNDPKTQGLREHFENYGININDADNGVFLPSSLKVKTENNLTAISHSKIHTNDYVKKVNDRLINLHSESEIRTELRNIKTEILHGTF